MKRGLINILAILIFVSLSAIPANCELSSKEILRRADESRGNLQGIRWNVHILSLENGQEQERTLGVAAKGYDFLATMNEPPKVKGQKVLMVDHNTWFTKPGVKKPVPISSRQKLVGGAAYGDIAATNYADDYEVLSVKEEEVEGELCYSFDLKAYTTKATYDKIQYWISKTRQVGIKGEYYTLSGKLFKTARMTYQNQVKINNETRPFISKLAITDALVEGNVTTLEFNNPRLEKVSDSTLDLNFLK